MINSAAILDRHRKWPTALWSPRKDLVYWSLIESRGWFVVEVGPLNKCRLPGEKSTMAQAVELLGVAHDQQLG